MTRMHETLRRRWAVPVFSLLAGIGLAAIWFFAIMLGYGVLLAVLSSRSEVVVGRRLRRPTHPQRRPLPLG